MGTRSPDPLTPVDDPSIGLAVPEEIRFYIVRDDNSMIPLVPVDQLQTELQGVPRKLCHQQLSTEKWQWVGNTTQAPQMFLSKGPSQEPQPSGFRAPDHEVNNVSKAMTANCAPRTTVIPEEITQTQWPPPSGCDNVETKITTSSQSPLSAGAPLLKREAALTREAHPPSRLDPPSSAPARFPTFDSAVKRGDYKSHSEGIARIYQRDAQRYGFVPHPLPPSGIEPDPSKKEYCTHWIRTGDCAFMSQGCLFKHEMPLPHKLREIGFRETPRWWKEKSVQLQAPTWMERRLTEQNGDEYGGAGRLADRKAERLMEKIGRMRDPQRGYRMTEADERDHHAPKEEKFKGNAAIRIEKDAADSIPNLIDLDIVAPPPSLCQSEDSTTSASPAVTSEKASLRRSIPASPELPSGKTQDRHVVPTPASGRTPEFQSLVRRFSSISISSAEEASTKQSASMKGPAPALQSTTKFGLAQSKHAEVPLNTSKKRHVIRCEKPTLPSQPTQTGKTNDRRRLPHKRIVRKENLLSGPAQSDV